MSGTPIETAASGASGRQSRRKPYVPIFSSTPARSTLPAVGASTWASGSQVWKRDQRHLDREAGHQGQEDRRLKLSPVEQCPRVAHRIDASVARWPFTSCTSFGMEKVSS